MQKELDLLLPLLESAQVTTVNGFTFHQGNIGSASIIAMKCGIGKVNAALGTMTMIDLFSPELVINTGVAGGTGGNAGVAIVSRERWSAEFRKMLFGRNVRDSLGVLAEIGGLKYMNQLMRELSETVPEPGDKPLLEMGIDAVCKLEEEGVEDETQRLAAFFGNVGMLRTAVRDKSGTMRYPRHEHIGGLMAGKLLKHMGMDKELAEDVKDIIQGRGEVRRKKEKQARRKAHIEHQERQQAERSERRRERAARHRAMIDEHRKRAALRRKSKQTKEGE